MAYATVQDMRDRVEDSLLVRLTDDTGTGQVDEVVVQRALDDATGELDGYLGTRYALPLGSVPPIIQAQCVALALHQLHGRRRDVPDHVETRRREAIRFMERVAEGKVTLGPQDPHGTPDDSDRATLHMDSPGRVFTKDSMGGF